MSRYDTYDYAFGYGIEVETITDRILPDKFRWLLEHYSPEIDGVPDHSWIENKLPDEDMSDYVREYINRDPFMNIGDVFLCAGIKTVSDNGEDWSESALKGLSTEVTAEYTYLFLPYYAPWETDMYTKEDVDKAIVTCIASITDMTEDEIRFRIEEFIRYCDD